MVRRESDRHCEVEMFRISLLVLLCVLGYSEGSKLVEKACRRNETGTFYAKVPCCKGWEYNAKKQNCRPICRPGCINGECKGPNECLCKPPLVLNWDTCMPYAVATCTPPCGPNSTCTYKKKCACHEGFRSINSTHCVPRCASGYFNNPIECEPKRNKCVNATYVAPNNCTCKVGYTKVDEHTCKPKCDPVCENATCIEPNNCSCFNGFYKLNTTTTKCAPICTNCSNGYCLTPNNCTCHKGYEKRDGKCEPICETPCTNGKCIEPNRCHCDVGYDEDPKNKYNCLPVCEPKCVNSTCVAPGQCKCLAKYDSTEVKHICKPHCDVCENGACIAPDECSCNKGFNWTQGACSPICSTDCVNSRCTSPEICTCFEGYTKNSTTPSICYKECVGPCENGTCDLDGKCVCDLGYELLNNSCVINAVDCNTCVSNCTGDICRCESGQVCFQYAEVASSTNLAGLELTWMLGAAIGFLLIVLVLVIIVRIGQKRHQQESKTAYNGPSGSVVFTVADTLIHCRPSENSENQDRYYEEVTLGGRTQEERESNTRLLQGGRDERL